MRILLRILRILLKYNLSKKLFIRVNELSSPIHWEIEEEFKSEIKKRILVYSPHIDDETFACGGTLYKLSKYAEIDVLYFKEDKIRFKEREEAFKILNIKKYYSSIEEIENREYEYIFAPHFFEAHHTHIDTVGKLYYYLKNNLLNAEKIFLFEMWTPLFANLIVDITDLIDIKKKAINCYKSQLKEYNYENAVLGLNAYRSLWTKQKNGYAESFLCLTKNDFIFFYENLM